MREIRMNRARKRVKLFKIRKYWRRPRLNARKPKLNWMSKWVKALLKTSMNS